VNVEPTPLLPGKGTTMCVYGLPGTGKTRLLGSGAGKVLIVRPPTDNTDSIPPPAAGVEEVVIHDWDEQLHHFQWGQQGGYDSYDWVGLDSVSLFEEVGLDDVFEAAVMRKESRREFGPDKGEYGVNRTRLSKWVRDMVGMAKAGRFNFLCTAHVMQWTDPVKDVDLWVPAVGDARGKYSAKFMGYFNIVAYMAVSQKEGKARQETLTVDSDGFAGKDQFQVFPELKSGRHGFVNPTLEDIDQAIAAARKPSRRRTARTARKRRPAAARRGTTRKR
jgi:hypothetical protein